jgi:hypothetical protein
MKRSRRQPEVKKVIQKVQVPVNLSKIEASQLKAEIAKAAEELDELKLAKELAVSETKELCDSLISEAKKNAARIAESAAGLQKKADKALEEARKAEAEAQAKSARAGEYSMKSRQELGAIRERMQEYTRVAELQKQTHESLEIREARVAAKLKEITLAEDKLRSQASELRTLSELTSERRDKLDERAQKLNSREVKLTSLEQSLNAERSRLETIESQQKVSAVVAATDLAKVLKLIEEKKAALAELQVQATKAQRTLEAASKENKKLEDRERDVAQAEQRIARERREIGYRLAELEGREKAANG